MIGAIAIVRMLGQAPAGSGPSAAAIFYLTLLFIFLTAIVTTVVTKWARDKCLKFLHGYHVTLERGRGQVAWGRLKVFSSGIELVFDRPFVDATGRKKTSALFYQPDIDAQLLSVFRYHDELTPQSQAARDRQVRRSFNPGPLRRLWRGLRNLVNTLRDAFGAAIGAVVGQYQKVNPASSVVLGTQGGAVTQIGQTLLGRFANAYEPLLEQYIGQPVILDVVDPSDPNNKTIQFTGYLADYTQQFVALFNVAHLTGAEVSLALPEVEPGAPPPPGPGAPPPPPAPSQQGIAIAVDGPRFRIHNQRSDLVVVRELRRDGYEPVCFGTVLPPNAFMDVPARDARGGTLWIEVIRCVDIVAPRKFATVRNAGELVDRPGILDEFALERLPLVPRRLKSEGRHSPQDPPTPATGSRDSL